MYVKWFESFRISRISTLLRPTVIISDGVSSFCLPSPAVDERFYPFSDEFVQAAKGLKGYTTTIQDITNLLEPGSQGVNHGVFFAHIFRLVLSLLSADPFSFLLQESLRMGLSSYSPLPYRDLLASTLGLFLFDEIISYKVLPALFTYSSRSSYICCTRDPPINTSRASVFCRSPS